MLYKLRDTKHKNQVQKTINIFLLYFTILLLNKYFKSKYST